MNKLILLFALSFYNFYILIISIKSENLFRIILASLGFLSFGFLLYISIKRKITTQK